MHITLVDGEVFIIGLVNAVMLGIAGFVLVFILKKLTEKAMQIISFPGSEIVPSLVFYLGIIKILAIMLQKIPELTNPVILPIEGTGALIDTMLGIIFTLLLPVAIIYAAYLFVARKEQGTYEKGLQS